jgi:hypothetical protein
MLTGESRISARHGAQKFGSVFLLIYLLTFTKVRATSALSIEEGTMPAGHRTVFRPEAAEIARLPPLAANGLPLSEREAEMP